MARREWFIDHDAKGWDAAATLPSITVLGDRIGFMIRPDEDDATTYVSFKVDDAVKLGKALVKAGKKAKEGRGS
jgi:hypothetical protein